MIEFIAAVYNEQEEIRDLLRHVYDYVDKITIVDDGSTDGTVDEIMDYTMGYGYYNGKVNWEEIEHTGLPETVKAEALSCVRDGSWVIMLDADERFAPGVLDSIRAFYNSPESEQIDYVYCRQIEIIDGTPVREFQKCKVFRKEAIQFPLNNIHADDVLTGRGIYRSDWIVLHRKTRTKQEKREVEYLNTYYRLLKEGHIDQGRYEWLVNLHHFVKPRG